MAKEIIEKLKKEIQGFKAEIRAEKVGRVHEVADGVVRIWGLSTARAQEMIEIETADGTVAAIALNLEEDSVGAVVLGNTLSVKEGDTCRAAGRILSVPVGRELVGRVVNSLMEPLDGRGPIFKNLSDAEYYPIEKTAPGVIARESVKTPLHTGIKAIDAMIPIGRGQRELIIGDRQTGKTAIAIDMILNQMQDPKYRRPICIYVAIGQRESKVRKIVAELEKRGAMKYTIVVSASASSPATLQYIAPFAGCAIGEFFMDKGEDAVVIYDDLSKHAAAYRQISLLLRRPPGREAYPGDIFYLHSRLLERAAKMSKENGGGSLTALPIIETQLSDVSAYIPTNIISITDGQIYLEPDLFYQGIRPAVNVGLSVSRVGSAAQTLAMRRVAGRLRLELAQFRELQAFVQFASDLDEATRTRIERGMLLTEILKQNDFAPLPYEEQVVVFYAAVNGHFDGIAIQDVKKREEAFLDFIRKIHPNILEEIRSIPEGAKGDIPNETKHHFQKALTEFKNL